MTRHLRRGTARIYSVTTLTSTTAPSAAQIVAGLDLTSEVMALEGFELETEIAQQAYYDTPFAEGVRRVKRSGPPALVLYDRKDGVTTYRAGLAEGLARFIVLAKTGIPAAGTRVDVWPVECAASVTMVSAEERQRVARCPAGGADRLDEHVLQPTAGHQLGDRAGPHHTTGVHDRHVVTEALDGVDDVTTEHDRPPPARYCSSTETMTLEETGSTDSNGSSSSSTSGACSRATARATSLRMPVE